MASIWLVLAIILGLAYLLLMASILVGWFKINKEVITSEIADKKAEIKVSVLIAFRNEAPHLPNILEDLIQQNYPVGLSEFILINDHSSDKGPAIIEKCQQQHSAIRLLNSPPDEKGKKKALRYGLSFSQGEIILFTDADCRLSPDWISTMVQSFSDPSCILCQGPVMISPAKTLLAKLQQIEFLSLMMSAAGSIGIRQGILVSGANLAVSKKFYQKVSLELKDHINTGDDMFLLEQETNE